MWTAAQIVAQAAEDAHIPGAVTQAQNKLQLILDTLCFTGDYALARGVYYFPLNPANITTIGGITNFGGPYPLPLDYLRTSGSSGAEGIQYAFFYVYNGVPYPLLPWDLGKMDMQVQQPGIQNLPYAYTTDISPETTAQDRIAAVTTAGVTLGSTTITLANSGSGTGGGAVVISAGGGVVILPSGAVELTGTTSGLVGLAIAGLGIAPGSFIVGTTSGTGGVMLDASGNVVLDASGNVVLATTGQAMLSLPATGTFSAASVMLGTPPNAYVYPGPSGAFPTTLRYQRMMPPLQDFTRVPWFQDQKYLLKELTAMMMDGADDSRQPMFLAQAKQLLGEYETFMDDKTSRAQMVQMDRNRFGRAFNRLPNTKTIGW